MRAAATVAERLRETSLGELEVTLFASLALTCRGHGVDRAILAGLAGHDPETVDPRLVLEIDPEPVVLVGETHLPRARWNLVLQPKPLADGHPNAIRFVARRPDGSVALDTIFRSVGGGFVTEDDAPEPARPEPTVNYASAAELLRAADEHGSIADVAAANEAAWRDPAETDRGIGRIVAVMDESIERGLVTDGVLPGGLQVRRRAAALRRDLGDGPTHASVFEWLAVWAMAVNEENAAGGRIVTAPTNGAAGVFPAVLRYARTVEGADDAAARRMLLTAGAIGALLKRNASISGAEVGCQGEVGSAAAMAAAALAEMLGGTPEQTANAAEIALEHHLGMTCDPIGGLVQVPCIERNAMGATKAVAAARLALRGDGQHIVSLDQVIDAMRRTGRDMRDEYKETARGGLAVSVPAC